MNGRRKVSKNISAKYVKVVKLLLLKCDADKRWRNHMRTPCKERCWAGWSEELQSHPHHHKKFHLEALQWKHYSTGQILWKLFFKRKPHKLLCPSKPQT